MIDDRYVGHYIALAKEMRRQYLASLVRQAWAGLTRLARKSWARLSALTNPAGKVRGRAT
jgi:hypothetical protein